MSKFSTILYTNLYNNSFQRHTLVDSEFVLAFLRSLEQPELVADENKNHFELKNSPSVES